MLATINIEKATLSELSQLEDVAGDKADTPKITEKGINNTTIGTLNITLNTAPDRVECQINKAVLAKLTELLNSSADGKD